MVKVEKMGKDNLPSIFVIIEAKGLHYKGPEEAEELYSWIFQDYNPEKKKHLTVYNSAPYNVFRRIFRMFIFTWERLMLVVVGTSQEIKSLMSVRWNSRQYLKAVFKLYVPDFTFSSSYFLKIP
jgi:hypothetical protein